MCASHADSQTSGWNLSCEGVAVSLRFMTEHLPRVCLEWRQEVFHQSCPYAEHVLIAKHGF